MPGIGVEINRSCVGFGAVPDYETQIFDGHLRGLGARMIKQVDFRADFRGHHDTRGRTWSNVTLRLAECLHDGAISTTFSRNPIGTQTTVFNATVSWPTIRGYPHPSAPPNVWAAEVVFPFQRPWTTSNKRDVLQHYRFTAGRLTNGGAWSQTRPARYPLDSAFIDHAGTGFVHYLSTGPQGCIDSAHRMEAQVAMRAETYAPRTFQRRYDGQVVIDTYVELVAPSRTVISAFSPARRITSVSWSTCQRLGIDTSLVVLRSDRADASGRVRGQIRWPYQRALANVRLYKQAIWSDSRLGTPKLTWQSMVQIAQQPLGKLRVLYRDGSRTPVVSAAMQRIPLIRYTFQ